MPIDLPSHATHPWFDVVDDCLLVGGQRITDLGARVGRTPFYVYDRGVMTRKVAELRKLLPPAVHLHYAMKANPMPAVVSHMCGLVDGLDVASAAEMQIALNAGGDPRAISFAGPGKTDAELSSA